MKINKHEDGLIVIRFTLTVKGFFILTKTVHFDDYIRNFQE